MHEEIDSRTLSQPTPGHLTSTDFNTSRLAQQASHQYLAAIFKFTVVNMFILVIILQKQ